MKPVSPSTFSNQNLGHGDMLCYYCSAGCFNRKNEHREGCFMPVIKANHKPDKIYQGFIPPRKWELDQTSSWINFHLGKDHQGSPSLEMPMDQKTHG